MGASLVVVHVDGRQHEVALTKPVHVLGRANDCSLRIPSARVSRHHCEVTLAEGRVAVRDLGSSNGTFVNRRRVTQADLSAGDMISVGDFVFVVKIDGRPASVDSEEVIEDGLVEVGKGEAGPSVVPSSAATSTGQRPQARPAPTPDPDGSSASDFDFLNEDDDIKGQPKL
jgi:pSer/pThr/pTyr-binding forkhead associated (FHA) protein